MPTSDVKHEGPLVAIPIHSLVTTEGIMSVEQVACFDPENPMAAPRPGGCEWQMMMFLNTTGTFTGRFTDFFHFHFAADGKTIVARGTRVFTGAIDGCGSGVLTLDLDGLATLVPNAEKPGYLHLVEPPMTLLPGSTTNGLARVEAATVTTEGNVTFNSHGAVTSQDGRLGGTIWCRPGPAAQGRPDHAGTTAMPVSGHFTMDNSQTESQVSCDLDAKNCEYQPDLFLDLAGTLTGRIIDHGHFHPTKDPSDPTRGDSYGERIFTGSVAGCGSGTMTGIVQGPTHLDPSVGNIIHMREPLTLLVPGSTTTGLGALRDIEFFFEWNMTLSGAIRDGTVKGTAWCEKGTDAAAPKDHQEARAVPATFKTTTDGFLGFKTANCGHDPAAPFDCDAYPTQYLYANAPWRSMILDQAHLHQYENGTIWTYAERTFWGEVPGCGSGMMTLRLSGVLPATAPVVGKPGYLHMVEPTMRLVPGSTTTGLAGLVDAELTGDLVFTGPAAGTDTFTGTVWCR